MVTSRFCLDYAVGVTALTTGRTPKLSRGAWSDIGRSTLMGSGRIVRVTLGGGIDHLGVCRCGGLLAYVTSSMKSRA